jgi:hypothetical protein
MWLPKIFLGERRFVNEREVREEKRRAGGFLQGSDLEYVQSLLDSL